MNSLLKCNYQNIFRRTGTISNILNKYIDFSKEDILSKKNIFSICGRIIYIRIMGKATFIKLKDFSSQIQLYLSVNSLINYKNIVLSLSLGDIIAVQGSLFLTKTKELSLNINFLELLNKIHSLYPDKWHGLKNKELCYRYRYLDLMVNKKTIDLFVVRSRLINSLRNFFLSMEYLEVETPMMQLIPGGASAKPFKTYNRSLDTDLYLRISPELYLKRLIIGGFEKIFEIGKSFRNEGISNKHHPEFTMIEFYEVYLDYIDLMNLTENLFRFLSKEINGNNYIYYMERKIDFNVKFERLKFMDALLKYNKKLDINALNDKNILISYLTDQVDGNIYDCTLHELQEKLFDLTVEKNLFDPVFIIDYPVEISPLAKRHDENPFVTERFELYIAGKEIANGFSELNNPVDQNDRFLQQIKNRNDIENIESLYDKDYIDALNYGLPPTAGEGIGIDRLVMLFTDSISIKDVILFPLMKIK